MKCVVPWYRMYRKKTNYFFINFLMMTVILILPNLITVHSCSAAEAIEFITPLDSQMVFSKKPVLECKILVPFDAQSLRIELDYTDMTALAQITNIGFKLKPVQVVSPGTHTLTVSFNDNNNQAIIKELQFQTRHTETFEQADSQNYINVNYTNVLKKLDDANSREMSNWTVTSSINSQNTIAEGPFEFSLNTNLQYLDQQLGVEDPQEKGLEIIDYQFSGKYEKDSTRVLAALGDVNINETQNTVGGLARRGGSINIDINKLYASGFVVRSDQAYGLDGEYGLDFDDTDHIYGGTFGVRLFENRLDIKTIYAQGGEANQDTSYGIWPDPGGSRGDVYGFEIKTDFFDQKMISRFEYDSSDYDDDTSDSQDSKSDEAWFAGVEGQIDIVNYRASYDYTGLNYNAPGNYSILADREGFSTGAGLNFETQSISGFFEQHDNNVDDDPALTTTTSSRIGMEYSLFPLEWPTLMLLCERSVEDSSNEPSGTFETKTYTDTFSGTIEYQKEAWLIGTRPLYSQVDDKTTNDYDTSTKEMTLYCSYTHDKFTLGPSFSWNISKDHSSDVKTDTLTSQLGFSINIIEGLTFGGNIAYTKMYDSSDSVDSNDYNGDVQLEYGFTSPIKDFVSPSIILQATHQNNNDEIADSESKETIIYLLLSADLNLSF
jgi:hypothetical protein